MPACEKCNNKFPNYTRINGKSRNISRRKYCLECSPFGLHNTRQLKGIKSHENIVCKSCDIPLNPDNTYRFRLHMCKKCYTKHMHNKQRIFKRLCIDYKGGQCVKCGYKQCQAALQFHHLDPKEKDFQIGGCSITYLTDKVKQELDKCILVCANCHFELHYKG